MKTNKKSRIEKTPVFKSRPLRGTVLFLLEPFLDKNHIWKTNTLLFNHHLAHNYSLPVDTAFESVVKKSVHVKIKYFFLESISD